MPKNRKEFEHNMHLFAEQLEKGETTFAPTMRKAIQGILDVKYTPNRRVNLISVNEVARLMANTAADRTLRQEKKPKNNKN